MHEYREDMLFTHKGNFLSVVYGLLAMVLWVGGHYKLGQYLELSIPNNNCLLGYRCYLAK